MAGGEGTRLRPMPANQPKPLLPVVNRPIMEHVLRLLKRHGFDETVVTVQFLASLVRTYCGDGEELGMHLSYATEESPLGTAGSVRNAQSALRDDAPPAWLCGALHLENFGTFKGVLPPPGLYHRVLREIEGPLIGAALAATRGNQIRAAELLGVNRNTLRKKVRDLDLQVIRSAR